MPRQPDLWLRRWRVLNYVATFWRVLGVLPRVLRPDPPRWALRVEDVERVEFVDGRRSWQLVRIDDGVFALMETSPWWTRSRTAPEDPCKL